jgi:DNA-directed RNA polymerase I, II, and III subunit RPABC2
LSEEILIGPRKLTRFERARIVGARALQVSLGAPTLVELPLSMSDPIEISLAELEGNVLPMTLRRAFSDKTYQDIPLAHLTAKKGNCARGTGTRARA